jgi:hypothetical protein
MVAELEIAELLRDESPEEAREIMRLAAELEGEEFEQEAVARAREEQALMAGFNGGVASLRDGEVKMRVHPLFWHYWGQRLGYECWDDAGFVREFLRDNESVRVKNVRPRLTVTVPDVPRSVRSSKNYGVW